MIRSRRGCRLLLSLAVCGRHGVRQKGPPQPLARVPAAPANLQAARVGDQVYVWFTVPTANVSGQSPADLGSIDLYAVTATAAPAGPDLTKAATGIATTQYGRLPSTRRPPRRLPARHHPCRRASPRARLPSCAKR
ncbi:MAG: hypothetical protein R2712_16015 [Vicinamibacterales bacterium]